jgi:hypothetical protein
VYSYENPFSRSLKKCIMQKDFRFKNLKPTSKEILFSKVNYSSCFPILQKEKGILFQNGKLLRKCVASKTLVYRKIVFPTGF